jgi:hypothetical protein
MAAGYPMLLIFSSLLGRLRSLLRARYARRPNTLGLGMSAVGGISEVVGVGDDGQASLLATLRRVATTLQ